MLVFIHWLCPTIWHPQGKALIFYRGSLIFFVSSETLEEVSSGYICLRRDLIHHYTALFPSSVNAVLVPRSLRLYFSEWQEIKIFSDAGGNTACEEPDYCRETDIWRGFITDSKGGRRRRSLHGVFANVGFWPEKLNNNCSKRDF